MPLLKLKSGQTQSVKSRPAFLRSLGRGALPFRIRLKESVYRRVEVFKHDSFACTVRYELEPTVESDTSAPVTADVPPNLDKPLPKCIVVKSNRQEPLFGFPMRWLGRFLMRREVAVYKRMQEVENVPDYLGKLDDTTLIHAFVPGESLRPDDEISLHFLEELSQLVRAFHAREVAVVDIQKCENVVVGEDGRPYLLDFQISLALPSQGLGRTWPIRMLYRILVRSDQYHLTKHYGRFHPASLTQAQKQEIERRPFWVRLHRIVTRPLQKMRRQLLIWLGIRGKDGKASSELEAETGLKRRKISEKISD